MANANGNWYYRGEEMNERNWRVHERFSRRHVSLFCLHNLQQTVLLRLFGPLCGGRGGTAILLHPERAESINIKLQFWH
jgi:hypothetical protein